MENVAIFRPTVPNMYFSREYPRQKILALLPECNKQYTEDMHGIFGSIRL